MAEVPSPRQLLSDLRWVLAGRLANGIGWLRQWYLDRWNRFD